MADEVPPEQNDAPGEAMSESERLELGAMKLGELELIVVAIPADRAVVGLTPAEEEVAQLALLGHSNREIAARRGTSVKTVANQLRCIYQKLGITSRFELAARLAES